MSNSNSTSTPTSNNGDVSKEISNQESIEQNIEYKSDNELEKEGETTVKPNSINVENFGMCPICNGYNINYSWCQSCDLELLTQGWTSGNKTIDEIIKSTQIKATEYNNENYLQWIPYEDLTNIERIGKGGFATIYKAKWLNGTKYINYKSKERCIEDRTVALKRSHDSQNISDEFLNEVNKFNTTFVFFFS